MKERKPWRIVGKFGTIFLVNMVVLAFLVLGFGREYLRNVEIERSIRELEAQNAELESRKLESLSVIESLSSEYYLEGEARKKHSMARPGEQLVIVDDVNAASLEGEEEASGTGSSNIARWFYYFFAHDTFEKLRTL